MPTTKKTDNHSLDGKLELRRYFLRKYHAPASMNVLDCCQANGRIWRALRREFPTENYWGVDLKPKKGRIKVDSVRILDQPGWEHNVVDVDVYGSPWKHWFALLRNCKHHVTVFLTIGMVKVGGGNYDRALLPVLGIHLQRLKIPNSLGARLTDMAIGHALGFCISQGFKPVEALEAVGTGSARYIGIRLEKL